MSAAADTVVACCQLAPQLGELERNRAASCAAIVAAADAGARVVVLPELAVSGYVFAGTEEARALAEPVDGPTVSAWAALARERDLVVVGGLCERDGDVLRNSAVLIDARGLRGVYRKAHLWDREGEVFAAGSEAPPVIETAVGRIGIVVCYDLEFPEWVRLPALAGAGLLCAPVNWPAAPRPAGERPAEVVRVQAAAATNRMFIAACDRTGTERGVDWVGGSVIVDPDGFPLAGPAGPHDVTTLVARCRLGDARDKRLGERNDALADRRPELYGPLTATGPRA
ncbi:MAG: putative hydrolase [Conexibacter sp.]|nr:putative hydrolase [Conexibacter sp.]